MAVNLLWLIYALSVHFHRSVGGRQNCLNWTNEIFLYDMRYGLTKIIHKLIMHICHFCLLVICTFYIIAQCSCHQTLLPWHFKLIKISQTSLHTKNNCTIRAWIYAEYAIVWSVIVCDRVFVKYMWVVHK
jgi:hypothetical protein